MRTVLESFQKYWVSRRNKWYLSLVCLYARGVVTKMVFYNNAPELTQHSTSTWKYHFWITSSQALSKPWSTTSDPVRCMSPDSCALRQPMNLFELRLIVIWWMSSVSAVREQTRRFLHAARKACTPKPNWPFVNFECFIDSPTFLIKRQSWLLDIPHGTTTLSALKFFYQCSYPWLSLGLA